MHFFRFAIWSSIGPPPPPHQTDPTSRILWVPPVLASKKKDNMSLSQNKSYRKSCHFVCAHALIMHEILCSKDVQKIMWKVRELELVVWTTVYILLRNMNITSNNVATNLLWYACILSFLVFAFIFPSCLVFLSCQTWSTRKSTILMKVWQYKRRDGFEVRTFFSVE